VNPDCVAPADAERPVVIALDLGSSSIRALAFDRRGRLLDGCQARRAHAFAIGADGTAQADAAALLELAWACLDELCARTPGPVAGLCGCTFAASLVGVDALGAPVTPLLTYADTRAADQAAALAARLGEPCLDGPTHQRTGCPLHAAYWPAQLAWMAEAHPDWTAGADGFLGLGELAFSRLTGRVLASPSAASWTGLLDRRSLAWDEGLCRAVPVEPARLPPLASSGSIAGRLRPALGERWPALADAAVLPMVADGAAANPGSGCADASRLAISLGTSSAVRLVVDGAPERIPEGLWCYRLDHHRSLLGGALSEGGCWVGWARDTLALGPPAEVEAAIAAMGPDEHGLTVLPLLSGERAPGWAADARGAVAGLSLSTGPLHILRAGMEAVAIRIGRLVRALGPALAPDVLVVASGGAITGSPAWRQILADVLDRPVIASALAEASARGAALMALEALGDDARPDDPLGEQLRPDAWRHARYVAAAQRHERLYEQIVRKA